jgi:hypothetical protein
VPPPPSKGRKSFHAGATWYGAHLNACLFFLFRRVHAKQYALCELFSAVRGPSRLSALLDHFPARSFTLLEIWMCCYLVTSVWFSLFVCMLNCPDESNSKLIVRPLIVGHMFIYTISLFSTHWSHSNVLSSSFLSSVCIQFWRWLNSREFDSWATQIYRCEVNYRVGVETVLWLGLGKLDDWLFL